MLCSLLVLTHLNIIMQGTVVIVFTIQKSHQTLLLPTFSFWLHSALPLPHHCLHQSYPP